MIVRDVDSACSSRAFNIGAWSTYETSVEARSLLTKVDPPSHLGSSE